jgi:hypothetical protein
MPRSDLDEVVDVFCRHARIVRERDDSGDGPRAMTTLYDDAPMTQLPTSRRARRRRRWPIVLVILAALVAWGVIAALKMNHARVRTQAGIDQLQQARDVLSPTGLVKGEGIDQLRAAETDFSSARRDIRSPFLTPLRWLPVVGRQVRSVDAMTGAAAQVVNAGVDAIEGARTALRSPAHGHERVVIVQKLGVISDTAYRKITSVDLGPSKALIGPLQHARARFSTQLAKLADATQRSSEASKGMARFLEGPSHYLVFAANNNEMRVGSGTFLQVGEMTVSDGSFDLGPLTPSQELDLPPGAVQPTGDFAKRWGWLIPSQEWRNLGSSPLFPTQAVLATQMWGALGRGKVDGVLALDPVALRALIQATHPVTVDGKQYGPDNVLSEIYLSQYYGVQGDLSNVLNQARRDRLSLIARAAVDNLQGKFDTAKLADSLRQAAVGRHVLGWSSDKIEQQGWVAAGVAGTMQPDSLLLGVHNRGGNKLDQFLNVSSKITTTRDAQGTAVTLDVKMHNGSPTGLPNYVSGPYPLAVGSKEGLYQGLLVAELPSLARDMYITTPAGKRLPLAAVGADQTQWVVSTYIQAGRGQTAEAIVHFRLPPASRSMSIEPSARVPAVGWSHGSSDTWFDDQPHAIAW